MSRDCDIRRIEVIDDQTAEMLRRLGGEGRLRLMDELTEAGRELMAARVREQHPDWTAEQVAKEVSTRIRNAAA
ncbi:MAG TPA: hypothetical protein PKE29_11280 [Phycisphaerales bacterium]|nr:hypothetical protein [Phycisphaerales bacterium]